LSDQLLVGNTRSLINLGDAIVLLTTLLLALFNVYAGTVLTRHRATTMVPIATAGGLVVLLGLAAFDSALQAIPRLTGFDWIALCGTVGGAGVLLLWSWAIEHASAGRIAVFVAAAPISAAMTGSIVLSEPVTRRLLAGTVLIVAGIYLVYRTTPAAVPQEARIGDVDVTRASQSM
jgi:drug/metabolite transporter (DMT)-like permease